MGSSDHRSGGALGCILLEFHQEIRVTALEKASGVFDDWRMSMEGAMDDLRLEVGKISKHWERAVVDKSTSMAGVLSHVPTANERPLVGSSANSPHGHHFETSNWEGEFGSVTTLVHPPVVNDTHNLLTPTPIVHVVDPRSWFIGKLL
jgi:hypothetical protein